MSIQNHAEQHSDAAKRVGGGWRVGGPLKDLTARGEGVGKMSENGSGCDLLILGRLVNTWEDVK